MRPISATKKQEPQQKDRKKTKSLPPNHNQRAIEDETQNKQLTHHIQTVISRAVIQRL